MDCFQVGSSFTLLISHCFCHTGSIDRPQIPTGVQPTQEVPLLPVQTQDQPFSPPTYPSQNVAFQPQQPSYGASPGLQFPSDVPQQFTPFAGSAPQQINQYQAPGVQYAQDSFSVLPPGQDIGSSNTSPPSSLTRPTQVVPPQPQLQQPTQQPQQFPSTAQPGQPVASFVPVQPHWFFLKNGRTWTPFSYLDSKNLEVAYQSHGNIVVPTDGGRYDTDLDTLTRGAIYWKEQPCMVRRCTWFYKGDAENKLVPYEENIAQILEVGFKNIANFRKYRMPQKYAPNFQASCWSSEHLNSPYSSFSIFCLRTRSWGIMAAF